jgi:sec-independent protein translocase protein TatC
MVPDLVLVAGAAAWRLGSIVLLAAATLGALLALRVMRPVEQVAGTRMGFLAHVAELRRRLIWCVGTWTFATMAAFSFRLEPRSWGPVLGFIPVPALHDNLAAQVYRGMAAYLVPEDVQLVVLRPMDGFSAEFGIAMAIGFALALPVLLWHAAAFVGPALRPKERRMLRMTMLPCLSLFLAGATFAATILVPQLLETLYGYPEALGAEPFLAVGELVSFTLLLALVFGLASLTPMAMAGLAAAGLVGWRGFLAKWRHAIVAILVLCALATDGTVVTLAMVALPIVALYFIGVGLAAWAGRGMHESSSS